MFSISDHASETLRMTNESELDSESEADSGSKIASGSAIGSGGSGDIDTGVVVAKVAASSEVYPKTLVLSESDTVID